jgi:hypothetical protein
MKSYLRGYICSSLFILLMSLFIVSCAKDETTVGPDSSSKGSGSTYLTFKVNGVAMDLTQSGPIGYNSQSSSSPGSYITSSPSGFTHPELRLGFPGTATGTFTETTGGWLDFTDANDVNYYYAPYTCSITVTQYGAVDGYIVGTFSATKHSSNSTATITEGKFSVKRTY